MTTKIVLFHSSTPGNVPTEGLLTGEIAFNVADNFQFIGYGGNVNFDVYGNPLEILPPPGKGWKTFVTGGGDQPGPPGPGVPTGGDTGQILSKLSDGDYVTGWVDNYGVASPNEVGVLFGYTSPGLGGNSNVSLGFQAQNSPGTGQRNVSLGSYAGYEQNNNTDNVSIGYESGWNIDGNWNVSIGSQAMGNRPGGAATGNVAIGYRSAYNLTEGDNNIFVGYESGDGVRTGSANVIIGNYSGGSNWVGNVALADGSGDLKFLANQSGAWSTDGIDFGTDDFVLTSQGPNLPPIWKPVPLGFVSRIIAGDNITINPSSGTGVVTINATAGGGTGSVTSIQANSGLKVSSGSLNPITTSGGLEVDYTQVLGTYLYDAPGKIIYGGPSPASPVALPIGTVGQVLVVGSGNTLAWDSIEGASPATPTIFGTVYGSTSTGNTYYGYGAGVGPIGTGNTLIGLNAGTQVGAGSMNTLIGGYSGFNNLSGSVAISNGSGAVRFFANSAGAWSLSGDAQFGQAGQVLSSMGVGSPPQWVTPVNAPITEVNDGPGISTSVAGTTLTINNTGILSVTGFSPIIASNVNGNVSISAPNVLSDVQAGTGISIAGTGNSRTISNSGVVSLVNGTNTSVTQTSPGVWQVNASGGGSGSITSLVEGAGINITNPLGPNSTITNSGVVSIQSSANVVPSSNTGIVTLSLQNVVFGVTASSGITVGGTATNPTIANSGVISLQNGTGTTVQNVGSGVWQVNATGTAGVTKIVAGTNVSITPISGTGEVTINAAGGGGGGNITEIRQGTGITVNSGTGPITTITNNGVLALQAGSNVTIGGTANNPIINATGSLNNLTAGKGISITNATGPNATIVNSGVVGLVAGANITLQETGAGTGVFNISASGGGGGSVASVSGQGEGISISPITGAVVVRNTGVTSLTGTTGNISVSGSTGAVSLDIGPNVLTNVTAGNSGITIDGTGNSRTISAEIAGLTEGTGINLTNNSGNFTIDNTGVLGLTEGANVTITPTAGTPGNFTISATGGGGGGTGTVTSVGTGFGLTGGTITTSGIISANPSVLISYQAYRDQGDGAMLYSDTLGFSWTNTIDNVADNTYRQVLTGYKITAGTYVEWAYPEVAGLLSNDEIVFSRRTPSPIEPNTNLYYANTSSGFKRKYTVPWQSVNQGYDENITGMIPYSSPVPRPSPGTGIDTEGLLLAPPIRSANVLNPILTGTWQDTGSSRFKFVPNWVALNTIAVTSIGVTGPILNTGTSVLPNIGFDVNTTLLTQYVPNSAFTLQGQLLYGTGAGTFAALDIGNNGQILGVSNTGTLQWIDAPDPTPPPAVNLTPADDSIVMDPNPITGAGTIGVTPNKFVETAVVAEQGAMIYGDSNGDPSRLSIGTPGQVMVVSPTGIPSWVTDLDSGTY